MTKHEFGGAWTNEKLERLAKYLHAYMKIFRQNPKAGYFTTTYVDAFAGAGHYTRKDTAFQPLEGDQEAEDFQKGSAWIALESEPAFDRYLFIEPKTTYAHELAKLKQKFPERAPAMTIVQGTANVELAKWCSQTNWQKNRAVVFLDPYGMEVEWQTIEMLAATKAVDLWLLVPLGQAVNRLLTKKRPPPSTWADKLTKFFGTDEWQQAFYQPPIQPSLFEEENGLTKNTSLDGIAAYFVKRLESVFSGVAPHPLKLRNSNNVPIYLLCFASANEKGATTAVRIADHILNQSTSKPAK